MVTRPRRHTHARDTTYTADRQFPLCGAYGHAPLTDDIDAVDCQHCQRKLGIHAEQRPAWRHYSVFSKVQWRAMRRLAERHADEFAQLLEQEGEQLIAQRSIAEREL